MIKSNVEIGLKIRVVSDWPSIRCSAKTRRGTPCQKPPLKGKARCRLHGGLSSGPRKAKREPRRCISNMAEDQKDLLNSVKKFGLNSERLSEECEWMGLFKT